MGAPETPDYEAAAERTAASDKEMLDAQTKANRPNRNNPWGSETWDQDSQGNWTQNTTLNKDSQGALDSQLALQRGKSDLAGGMMGRLNDEFGEQMDWSQFGDQQGLEFDPSQLRQRAEDASYDRATSRLDPRFEQGQQSLEVKLANQGLKAGDEAYDNAMGNFNRGKEDAYSNAQNTAVMQGKGESAQDFQQQVGQADYANKLRDSAMNEGLTQRSTSLNEMNAVLNGQQVNAPQFNQFTQAGRSQGVDYSGALKNQTDFGQAQQQATMDAVTGIAGAGMGMMGSDRRLKRDIVAIGKLLGHTLYSFTYIWGEKAVGVMSDEINQDAVIKTKSGFDMVDYRAIKQKEV